MISKKGGAVDEKQKQIPFRLLESEHTGLKVLAAKKRKSVQQILYEALDKAFPGWRRGEEK